MYSCSAHLLQLYCDQLAFAASVFIHYISFMSAIYSTFMLEILNRSAELSIARHKRHTISAADVIDAIAEVDLDPVCPNMREAMEGMSKRKGSIISARCF